MFTAQASGASTAAFDAPRVAPSPTRTSAYFGAKFSDVVSAYVASTARPADAGRRLQFWVEFFGSDVALVDIDADMVDAGLAALAERGKMRPVRNGAPVPTGKPLAPATLSRAVADLAGVHRYARRHRLVPRTAVSPTRGLELAPSPMKTRFISAEDKDRLVKIARVLDRRWGKMAAFIEVAFSSGWRAGNLGELRWRSVDLDAGVIRTETSKNGDAQHTPISSAAVAELRRLTGKASDDRVFGNKSGGVYEYRRVWDRVTREAGLGGFNFHLLRHGCGSTLAAAGAGQAQIMAHMGHRSLAASRRYMHANVAAKQELARRVFG